MTDPFEKLVREVDLPVTPSGEFSQRLWNRLASEIHGSGLAPASDTTTETGTVTADEMHYVQTDQSPPSSPRRQSRRRWWTTTTLGLAAVIVLIALVVGRANEGNKVKVRRLEPAAAGFLRQLKADNDAYQLSLGHQFSACVPANRPTPDATSCRQGLAAFVATIQSILAHFEPAQTPASIGVDVESYRQALQGVSDAASRALQAVGTPTFRQLHAALDSADALRCAALTRLNAIASSEATAVGTCQAPR